MEQAVNRLLILADDLTGALDSGVQLTLKGEHVVILTDRDVEFPEDDSVDVIVVDTETRHVTGEVAANIIKALIHKAQDRGIKRIYKKTDSGLRGNVGAELAAVLEASGAKHLNFIPAYPATGRMTVNGVQYVNGKPLAESIFAKDPINPITVSRIDELIHFGSDVHVVSGNSSEKRGIVVYDAETNTDDEDDHLFDGIDDEDMKFLDDDESSDDTTESDEEDDAKAKQEAIKQNIRQEINHNFNPVAHKLDLKNFTISKKPINASKIINEIKTRAIECADGVLWSEKRAVRMSAFKPMEIQSLDPQLLRGNNANYNKFIENKLKLIYEHIIDANKPKTFEAWAMITPNTVMDDYMFTAYKATFGTANIVTFNCNDDNCNNIFMENVPVHSMIKFTDDKKKEEYMNILTQGNTDSTSSEYKVDLYQASDDYVFGLKIPSLYNTYIEPTLVDQKFASKYEDLILLLTYIDSVYRIDYNTRQLIPIDTKPVTDKVLTYKRRVKTYATILKSLTSDQLQALSVETDKYDAGTLDDEGNLVRDITYVYPERRCPKCGKKIDEVEVNPDNLLFTRHQLGLMKKI